jgi:DNA polymerase-3 subunit chi
MTEVLFVEVTANRLEMRACEIAERVYLRGDRLQISAADQPQADRIDDLLWTFRPDSFVPHGFPRGDKDGFSPPVVISIGEEKIPGFESLLMLNYCPVETVGQFSRVIHLVVADSLERLEASRRYWTQLKDAGFALGHQKR